MAKFGVARGCDCSIHPCVPFCPPGIAPSLHFHITGLCHSTAQHDSLPTHCCFSALLLLLLLPGTQQCRGEMSAAYAACVQTELPAPTPLGFADVMGAALLASATLLGNNSELTLSIRDLSLTGPSFITDDGCHEWNRIALLK